MVEGPLNPDDYAHILIESADITLKQLCAKMASLNSSVGTIVMPKLNGVQTRFHLIVAVVPADVSKKICSTIKLFMD